MPSELLDDGSVTTTKSIENFFENLDRELKKIGHVGFSKATNDLVIKYSKDLIESSDFKWRNKASKQKAAELNYIERKFNEAQKRLLERNVDDNDALVLTQKKTEYCSA